MKSLQIAAIHHIPWLEDRHTLSDGRVCIRLTTAANEFDAVTLRHAFHYAEGEPFAHATDTPMERMWRDENREVWQAVFAPRDPRIVYAFILRAGDVTLLHDADGTRAVPENPAWVSGFHYAHAYPAKEKPQWARGCVGYQIFPDRFRRVDVPGEEAVEPWGSKRVANEYRFGGNLKGILEAVPYLAELGVGVVYMTPIFLSDTSHRYNTFDYYQIDPLLGSLEDLRNLADALHARNIRIVLDGVTLYDSEQHINLTPQQRGVGYLFQSYALFPNMTVQANILTGLRREKDAAKKQAAFEHAIHLLKLEGLEDRRPAQLSGGQAQRVALARMLVSRPKALLLDEPFSAIDSHLRDQLQVDLLALLADFPGDVVIVTHSRDEAYHMCGQIAVMDAGRVLAHGPTKQVFADPRTVQGGRLTGCKNIFPARKVDDHTIFVPDWGVDLHPARMVEDGLVAMGVRAHYFRPEEERNPLAVHCVGKMEEPFEWIIRMRAEGQTAGSPDLWWRVSKEIVPETMPTRLGVAPEQVLLFYE